MMTILCLAGEVCSHHKPCVQVPESSPDANSPSSNFVKALVTAQL